jgi:hypothetical protein
MAFAGALVERWPVLFASLWSQLNADVWAMLETPGQRVFSVIATAICIAVAVLLIRLIRSSREARFWALGMAMALVPMAATFPMNRLLLFSGIGAFSLMAMLVDQAGMLDTEAGDRRRWSRWPAKALLVLHIPVAAIFLVASVAILPIFNLVFVAGANAAPRDEALAGQSLIFVNGQDFPCAYTLVIRQLDDDAPAPRRSVILAPMLTAATATREDDHTLVVDTDEGWLDYQVDRLMRSMDTPFTVGEHLDTTLFTAEVRRITSDGRPLTVAFRFHRPLEDPTHRWVWWRNGHLVDFPLPETGGRVELRPESLIAAAANAR